ncbi:MAG TPA: helix-turn-helix domain-containing protein [Candidatus Saccharimonadales bacterium]|nr:helix-turn-helix domain-containing protein [Candidatus Saccharimonadales bacterium]
MGVEEKALGQRLQKARQRAGLTQQELCQKAGLSYSTLAKIERGAIRAPSVFTVAAIAAATEVPLDTLLDVKKAEPMAKKTSKSGIKFVYFDLNGTLVRSYEKAFTKLSSLTGLPVDTIEAFYWRYDDDVCDGKMSMADFNRAMGQHLGMDDFDWGKFYLSAVEPVEGMAELVDWAAKNYEIGLFSNTMPKLIDGLSAQRKITLSRFSKVIDSSVVKMLKYGPEIFEYAQEEAGCAPESILLVDDDKLAVVNADKLGWQICRFNPYDAEASIKKVKAHLEL